MPRQCCPSVLGPADLTSALNSQCLEQEPFVMSRGKPMRPPSLQRAWRMKRWMRHLSGLTLNPSTQNAGADAWILSLRATHASHSPSPGKNRPKPTRATSGPTYGKSSGSSGPGSASSRTSPTIYAWALNKSTMTYDQWITALRRACLQRKKSVRHTAGNVYSSWPTPRAQEPGSTSSAHGKGLAETAKAWPTPMARDWKDSPGMRRRPQGQISLPNMAFRSGLRDRASLKHGDPSQMRLNPLFTEWLMGWPTGWTDFAPAAMAWSRWWPLMRSELFYLQSIINQRQ